MLPSLVGEDPLVSKWTEKKNFGPYQKGPRKDCHLPVVWLVLRGFMWIEVDLKVGTPPNLTLDGM